MKNEITIKMTKQGVPRGARRDIDNATKVIGIREDGTKVVIKDKNKNRNK